MEEACQVFTLGDPNAKQWRNIQGIGLHHPRLHAVCIKGVIYYLAIKEFGDSNSFLVSFDVSSEKFGTPEAPKTLIDQFYSSLINYQGKLGFMYWKNGMEIWVMEDDGRKKQEWSKIIFYDMRGFENGRIFAGVAHGGGIVFVNNLFIDSDTLLSVSYYDPNRNSFRCVEVEGTKAKDLVRIWVVPDHVEDTMRFFKEPIGCDSVHRKVVRCIYIPSDLLTVDILSKLPVKSLVRFQCVSKLWLSLNTDLIKTRSLTQPRLLVLFHHRPWLESPRLCSSTYSLNTNTRFISADKECRNTFTPELAFDFVSRYVRGLICCLSRLDEFSTIYNPTTRQSVVLPGIKYDTRGYSVDGFFGYDPVEDQYKVLCCNLGSFGKRSCQVFTLGSPKKRQGRNINSPENFGRDDDYRGPTSSVCINGIIYYIRYGYGNVILTFDVRFERFGHIQMPMSEKILNSTLVNYQGKLGCISYEYGSVSSEMCILEDHIEKQEWSKIGIFIPHHLLESLDYSTCIADATRNGEIVIMPKTYGPETLYAYFHDPKQNKTRKVELESTLNGALKYQPRYSIFSEPDHMENNMDLCRIQVQKKPATRLPFLKKQLLVIATMFRTKLMSLLDSLH
ncbi:unnamed protein product [Arabis nemorensis]|uniref:F-box domain-containing protein n=1 Tax=Arabis nemorensis TaxID=586526 RepID=A0A565CVM5_9BRAS|nr:unnamed protein product [Arabis nemorensis]